MEKSDRLWPGGPVFYYDDSLFPPSTDTFVLGAFARTRRGERVCDLGSGTGLLGLLLLAREPELHLTGVERCADACALARQTAERNGLEGRLVTVEGDLREYGLLPAGSFDAVVSNPPYFAAGSGVLSPDRARRDARADENCSLEELCAAAARLLRWGGRFSLVFRPERMAELFACLRERRLEPKRLRFVQHRPQAAPSLLLLESRLGGRPGLAVEPLLLLHDEQGRETEELRRIYFQEIGERP